MIKLQNNYFIDADDKQFILKQIIIREKKDTKEKYEDADSVGYYTSLSQALKGYVNKVMLDKTRCESVSLYQVLDTLKEIKEEIKAYE